MLSKRMRVASVERDRSFEPRVSSRVPKERQRFTPWLEKQINQGGIDGLEWIDKEKGIFRVPWVRVDKPEFELETHAELFKRWAQHTGKYRQGDQPDPSTWKTRFRCALRKMQEIVEIKELGSLEGSKPYRAFKFTPKLKGPSTSLKRLPGKVETRRRSSVESEGSSNSSGTEQTSLVGGQVEPWGMTNGWLNAQYYDEWDNYSPDGVQNQYGYGLCDQEANYFDLQRNMRQSCLLQEGINGAMYNEQYFAFHQLVPDWRDLMEPVMPEDWDKYFPGGIKNQYFLSVPQDQAMG